VEAIPPEQPDDAQGAAGTVLVQVDLSADSKILKVSLFKSSGNAALDRAAIHSTPQSTFQTERLNCQYIPASYIFRVGFQAQ
jgi:TonB family protein